MGHSDNMSFRQRISNWFTAIYMNTAYRLFTERKTNEQLIKRFGGDIPSIRSLARRTSMIFTNTHYSLSGPKPFTPAVVELGGIHIQKPKALDHVSFFYEFKNFQHIMNNKKFIRIFKTFWTLRTME